MEAHSILDQNFRRERTPEEDSEFYLLKMDAEAAMRRMNYARYALYFYALLVVVTGLIQEQSLGQKGAFVGSLIVGLVYVVCGLLSMKYEAGGFTLGLSILVVSILLITLADASNIFQGNLLEFVLLCLLFRAIKSSSQMKKIRQRVSELGASEEELLS